jgi:hypothetical protein
MGKGSWREEGGRIKKQGRGGRKEKGLRREEDKGMG